ncbi:MAG: hypothetical protein ACK4M3_05640, partial [Pyrobaculum sp.]
RLSVLHVWRWMWRFWCFHVVGFVEAWGVLSRGGVVETRAGVRGVGVAFGIYLYDRFLMEFI